MGILPLQFKAGEGAEAHGLTGTETYTIELGDEINVGADVKVVTNTGKTITTTMRLDTEPEVAYFKNGGILPFVLRKLINTP